MKELFGSIASFFDKLVDQPALLLKVILLVVGTALVVLGAAGGVQYSNYFPIPDAIGRYVMVAAGGALLVAGLLFAALDQTTTTSRQLPKADKFGAKITELKSATSPGKMNVTGDINRLPPDGYKLVLMRCFPDSRFVPVRIETKFEKNGSKYKWHVYGCTLPTKPGERRTVVAYLVGKSGQALLQYQEEAVNFYMANRTDPNSFVPAIKTATDDMIKLPETETEL
jgi:hypothetical protein